VARIRKSYRIDALSSRGQYIRLSYSPSPLLPCCPALVMSPSLPQRMILLVPSNSFLRHNIQSPSVMGSTGVGKSTVSHVLQPFRVCRDPDQSLSSSTLLPVGTVVPLAMGWSPPQSISKPSHLQVLMGSLLSLLTHLALVIPTSRMLKS
jgi:hypothetical protein